MYNYSQPYFNGNFGGMQANPYPQQQMYQGNQFQGNAGLKMAQQRPVQNIQQTPMELPIQEVKFATEDEAKGFIPFANTKVMLIDREKSVAYIKSADQVGQSYCVAYSFVPYSPQENKVKEIDTEDFVHKNDIKNLVSSDVLQNALTQLENGFKAQINDLKKTINIKKLLEGDNYNE